MNTEMKDVVVKVSGKRVSPTMMVVKSGKYEIITDKLGGEAPSPVEYVLAALAGCINIVGTIVAKDLGINIKDLEVNVEGVINPSKYMTGMGERAGYKEIRTEVLVRSDADLEILRKWIELVEERCPVGDNLSNTTTVITNIKKI